MYGKVMQFNGDDFKSRMRLRVLSEELSNEIIAAITEDAIDKLPDCDLNCALHNRKMSLNYSIEHGSPDMTNALIILGADNILETVDYDSPFIQALRHKKAAHLKVLLENSAESAKGYNKLLKDNVREMDSNCLQELLTFISQKDILDKEILLSAAKAVIECDHSEKLEILLTKIDNHEDLSQLLNLTIEKDRAEACGLILNKMKLFDNNMRFRIEIPNCNHGQDWCNSAYSHPIIVAIQLGAHQVLKKLVESKRFDLNQNYLIGVKPDSNPAELMRVANITPLEYAVYANKKQAACYLLSLPEVNISSQTSDDTKLYPPKYLINLLRGLSTPRYEDDNLINFITRNQSLDMLNAILSRDNIDPKLMNSLWEACNKAVRNSDLCISLLLHDDIMLDPSDLNLLVKKNSETIFDRVYYSRLLLMKAYKTEDSEEFSAAVCEAYKLCPDVIHNRVKGIIKKYYQAKELSDQDLQLLHTLLRMKFNADIKTIANDIADFFYVNSPIFDDSYKVALLFFAMGEYSANTAQLIVQCLLKLANLTQLANPQIAEKPTLETLLTNTETRIAILTAMVTANIFGYLLVGYHGPVLKDSFLQARCLTKNQEFNSLWYFVCQYASENELNQDNTVEHATKIVERYENMRTQVESVAQQKREAASLLSKSLTTVLADADMDVKSDPESELGENLQFN